MTRFFSPEDLERWGMAEGDRNSVSSLKWLVRESGSSKADQQAIAQWEAEFRKQRGLGPDDPVPVTLPRMVLEADHARKLEAQRETERGFLPRGTQTPQQKGTSKIGMVAIVPPILGWTQDQIDKALDKTVERNNFRKKDFFSIPAIENRVELFARSRPGARNDVKAKIKGAEASGNFLFGAEAAAAGLTETEALLWARGAQIYQDVKAKKWPSGRDNPGDADRIRDGYRYFHQRYRASDR